MIRHSNADKRLSVSVISKSRDENEEKRLPERQTSSPSAFSLGSKTKESLEEEKEKDEKQPDTNESDDLRPLSETQLADVGDTNSSERLLSSSLPSQDLPTFAKSVTPENSREEDKILERQSGTESKGRTGMSEYSKRDLLKLAIISNWSFLSLRNQICCRGFK